MLEISYSDSHYNHNLNEELRLKNYPSHEENTDRVIPPKVQIEEKTLVQPNVQHLPGYSRDDLLKQAAPVVKALNESYDYLEYQPDDHDVCNEIVKKMPKPENVPEAPRGLLWPRRYTTKRWVRRMIINMYSSY